MRLLDLPSHEEFAYRSALGLGAFTVSSDYLYTVSGSRLIQTELRSARSLSVVLPFSDASPHEFARALILKNVLYLVSRESVWLFDGNMHLLRQREPLSVDFIFSEWICSFGEESACFFIPSEPGRIRRSRLIHRNGLCSAVWAHSSILFIGFENGKVYQISDLPEHISSDRPFDILMDGQATPSSAVSDGTSASGLDNTASIVSPTLLADVMEPILCMTGAGETLFFGTVSCAVVRLAVGASAFKYARLDRPARQIVSYQEHLVCSTGRSLVFLTDALEPAGLYRADFTIVDVAVRSGLLYVGYDCGLVISYTLAELLAGP